MAIKYYFETQKTARYFTHNHLSDQTETILIIIHGYAQTADHIIERFASFDERFFIVAPEGLNRFYSRGFGGLPVANWMTSLEREAEIKDYIKYFDALYEHLQLNSFKKAKIVILGFSQGVSTASRWVQATSNKIDLFIMIAGEIAIEMQEQLPDKMQHIPKAYLIGNSDNIIKPDKVEMMRKLLGDETHFKTFEGSHEINEACLQLIKEII